MKTCLVFSSAASSRLAQKEVCSTASTLTPTQPSACPTTRLESTTGSSSRMEPSLAPETSAQVSSYEGKQGTLVLFITRHIHRHQTSKSLPNLVSQSSMAQVLTIPTRKKSFQILTRSTAGGGGWCGTAPTASASVTHQGPAPTDTGPYFLVRSKAVTEFCHVRLKSNVLSINTATSAIFS